MPVRGAKVRRSSWFVAVENALHQRHFDRCGSSSGIVSPGFYFYGRAGYRVQIAPKNTLRIFKPCGHVAEYRVPELRDVIFTLDALELSIEFPD
jgi:hypothetical protein